MFPVRYGLRLYIWVNFIFTLLLSVVAAESLVTVQQNYAFSPPSPVIKCVSHMIFHFHPLFCHVLYLSVSLIACFQGLTDLLQWCTTAVKTQYTWRSSEVSFKLIRSATSQNLNVLSLYSFYNMTV
jgi:hypothetical protein